MHLDRTFKAAEDRRLREKIHLVHKEAEKENLKKAKEVEYYLHFSEEGSPKNVASALRRWAFLTADTIEHGPDTDILVVRADISKKN